MPKRNPRVDPTQGDILESACERRVPWLFPSGYAVKPGHIGYYHRSTNPSRVSNLMDLAVETIEEYRKWAASAEVIHCAE